MHEEENKEYETVCPRCGADAVALFSLNRSRVEVVCPDCGSFEMSREEFDLAMAERAWPEEREQ